MTVIETREDRRDGTSTDCDEEPCRSAVQAFFRARADFREKKAAHDTECAELKAAGDRLITFLTGLGIALGAYIGSAITLALQSLAAGAGVAAALTAVGG